MGTTACSESLSTAIYPQSEAALSTQTVSSSKGRVILKIREPSTLQSAKAFWTTSDDANSHLKPLWLLNSSPLKLQLMENWPLLTTPIRNWAKIILITSLQSRRCLTLSMKCMWPLRPNSYKKFRRLLSKVIDRSCLTSFTMPLKPRLKRFKFLSPTRNLRMFRAN